MSDVISIKEDLRYCSKEPYSFLSTSELVLKVKNYSTALNFLIKQIYPYMSIAFKR